MERLGQGYAVVRLVWGVAQIVLPGAIRQGMGLESEGTARFDQRLVGARDAAMGGGILAGRLRGSSRHWFVGCAAVDAADALVFAGLGLTGRLSKGRAALAVTTALGSAAVGAALALDAASREELVGAKRDTVSSPAAQVEYPPAG
jgi:hypothetical protein